MACTRQLHGIICPVIGNSWTIKLPYYDVGFSSKHPYRTEMLDVIRSAVLDDLLYNLPPYYQRGSGDTYFSGKMIAKLARILLIADDIAITTTTKDGPVLFEKALAHLRECVSIWLNSSSTTPIVYDSTWGGVIGCGCDFNGATQACNNEYPNCPTLSDVGQNFGNGFYNDHHFHYGYHIYGAAVVARFDKKWGRAYHQRVLALIRDIANPSNNDPYFTVFRHKDWYMHIQI